MTRKKGGPPAGPQDTPERRLRLVGPGEAAPPPPPQTPVSPPVPQDSVEGRLDLNRYLIKHPNSTFYVRVSGDSMMGAGIHPGSILVVDRAVEADDGDIVIARINDELVVKRLRLAGGCVFLLAENDDYQPVEVADDADFEVWGSVMHSIHSYREAGQ